MMEDIPIKWLTLSTSMKNWLEKIPPAHYFGLLNSARLKCLSQNKFINWVTDISTYMSLRYSIILETWIRLLCVSIRFLLGTVSPLDVILLVHCTHVLCFFGTYRLMLIHVRTLLPVTIHCIKLDNWCWWSLHVYDEHEEKI